MKNKIFALTMAILAGLIVYFALARVFITVPVVTAKVDIVPETIIGAEHVQITNVAKKDRQPGSYSGIQEITDKQVAFQIFAGQQILKKQLTDEIDETPFIEPQQTLITLSSQQVQWPDLLSVNDLITVIGVYSESSETREEAIGKIVGSPSRSLMKNFKNIQEAQATDIDQTKISFITDIESAKRVLLALRTADMVYLMPRHPELEGVE